VVTADAVWSALAEIPDPEIPVISLVDLGVIRQVEVEGSSVRVEFTPTFLGCPALETMRDAMATRIRELGAEPDVRVVVDDSWSTDRITPEGREKLREAGFAPPTPREATAPTIVQLQTGAFKCPYCGSTDTRLENMFGPTPCRSLRYCASCRQPFEQFKTI
jgi:ring-1,2-phenylacetyl-CoA epoxidase subunit PaaD